MAGFANLRGHRSQTAGDISWRVFAPFFLVPGEERSSDATCDFKIIRECPFTPNSKIASRVGGRGSQRGVVHSIIFSFYICRQLNEVGATSGTEARWLRRSTLQVTAAPGPEHNRSPSPPIPRPASDPGRLAPPRRASQHLPLQMAQSGDATREHEPIRGC